jgi:hypothetical protein
VKYLSEDSGVAAITAYLNRVDNKVGLDCLQFLLTVRFMYHLLTVTGGTIQRV